MAKLLFVAATEGEVAPLSKLISSSDAQASVLITGVGMVNTSISLTDHLHVSNKPDLVINAGIAGSFSKELEIGRVVQVVQDRLSELGVEDGDEFVSANDLDLMGENEVLFLTDKRVQDIPDVTGITVNTVHGKSSSIDEIMKRLSPDVESMEGAAIAAVCQKFSVPWLQIRAISNHVETRDTSKWDIPLAVKNLNDRLIKLLEELK